jgi:dUTP pyrophosphatase
MMTRAPVLIKRLPHAADLPLPTYADDGAGAFDLMAAEDGALGPFERKLVPTGIAVEIPAATALLLLPRSGLALKHGVTLANAPGLVDSSYRGEIGLILQTHDSMFSWQRGDRLAQGMIIQFVAARFLEVDRLSETQRGTGGFGSTGH